MSEERIKRLPTVALKLALVWLTVLELWAAQEAHTSGRPMPGVSMQGPVVELLSTEWLFKPLQAAVSTLTSQSPQAEFTLTKPASNSFAVKLMVNVKEFAGEKCILDVPNVLNVRLRQHNPLDRDRQNYPAFRMPDGSVPVLEATVVLHSAEHPDWTNMTIGIPLAMLARPQGQHELVLNFAGPDWKMYVDGEMLDNDFPFGYPRWPATNQWNLDPEYVSAAALYLPGIKPDQRPAPTPRAASGIQYWLPHGHNNWVGDVETFFYQGRYHVFYLYDRRHHQSKFGCGAHYFEHLSTTDFTTWIEHEAATPLDEQWECIGTGVPFVFNQQLCLAYGLHTTRVYPQDKTTLPAQWEYLSQNGRSGGFNRANTPGVPAGATYAVSADGVSNFKKSNVVFHPCENPTVYTAPDGKLRLFANYRSRGTWESESPDGGWHCINPAFPPGGDCTIFFRWGNFDYVMGGFNGLWSKPADAPETAYEDVVRKGIDFYDGTSVPSVTGIADGRFLMAAWIRIRGWGGNLVIRELIQFPDGRIGSKWMREITPHTETPRLLGAAISEPTIFPAESRSFILAFDVLPKEPQKGRVAISFLPEKGEQAACELQIRLDDLRAQFGPGALNGFAPVEKSLRDGGVPQDAANYAIENLIGVDRPFTVRVLVKNSAKLGGSLIDAELAGKRTMISFRPELTVSKLHFRPERIELRNVLLAPLPAEQGQR